MRDRFIAFKHSQKKRSILFKKQDSCIGYLYRKTHFKWTFYKVVTLSKYWTYLIQESQTELKYIGQF